ncbi:MarR family winged helix-turn-helix transcriptional regulator [Variibacter gotjawalensis]|nr:MarR family transcriptional regulator [Variibacter gotjawalensis]NIK48120.1 MarR family transcriptional regulator for hemolysin [Variibacter gotjawalensis]
MTKSLGREFAFALNDVARLLRTLADQRVRSLDMTRAQWAVLMRLERYEGLKQAELAEMLDIAPITLTRLVDRLCDNGLVERRNDPSDRRAKRLHLLPAARPMVERLKKLGDAMMDEVLAGVDRETVETILRHLNTTKDNLRAATQQTRLAAE